MPSSAEVAIRSLTLFNELIKYLNVTVNDVCYKKFYSINFIKAKTIF